MGYKDGSIIVVGMSAKPVPPQVPVGWFVFLVGIDRFPMNLFTSSYLCFLL